MVKQNFDSNFLTASRELYPLAMDLFDKFYMWYFVENNLTDLFNSGVDYQFGGFTQVPNFDEWPLAFQMGVVLEWYQTIYADPELNLFQYGTFKENFMGTLIKLEEIQSGIVCKKIDQPIKNI